MEILGLPVKFVDSIPVITTPEPSTGEYVVVDHVINMYGSGNTAQEAYDDWEKSVWEYYEELVEDECNLGHSLKKHLAILRQIVAEKGEDNG